MHKKIVSFIAGLLVFLGATAQGKDVIQIKITASNVLLKANLNNSATAQDFIAKLPIKLKMRQHQNREYYTSLQLSKSEASQDGYKIGDIAY